MAKNHELHELNELNEFIRNYELLQEERNPADGVLLPGL